MEFQDPEFIIGGTELDKNVWEMSRRYLVALAYSDKEPTPTSTPRSCTATLISRRVVLTAARELEKLRRCFLSVLYSQWLMSLSPLTPSLGPIVLLQIVCLMMTTGKLRQI